MTWGQPVQQQELVPPPGLKVQARAPLVTTAQQITPKLCACQQRQQWFYSQICILGTECLFEPPGVACRPRPGITWSLAHTPAWGGAEDGWASLCISVVSHLVSPVWQLLGTWTSHLLAQRCKGVCSEGRGPGTSWSPFLSSSLESLSTTSTWIILVRSEMLP